MDKKEVGLRVSYIRNKMGLSARELSLRIGKNEAYISRLESSKDSFEPSVTALLDIIEVCGMTESEFFYDNINDYENDKKILDLIKKTKNKEIKESIIKILENV